MCGICFICTLSGKSLSNEHHQHEFRENDTDKRVMAASENSLSPFITVNSSNTHNDQMIHSSASRKQHEDVNNLFADPLLHQRGPDVSSEYSFTLAEGLNGYMQGCVLHLRGNITPQPIKDAIGNALLWNGEIFDGIQVEEHENDTQVLFSHLISNISEEHVLKTMQKIQGPWAFIFWQADTQKLWFGRDMFGRRSLLWHLPLSSSDHLILTSVALREKDYTEVPSVGIFCLDFSKATISGDTSTPLLTLYPWKCCRWPGTSVTVIGTEESNLPTYLYPNLSSCLSVCVDKREILDAWIPGINEHLPDTEELSWISGIDVENCSGLEDILVQILKTRSDLDALAEEMVKVLQQSVIKRVNNLPRNRKIFRGLFKPSADEQNGYASVADCQQHESYLQELECGMSCCDESRGLTSHANVAVLFSGGLDSTILAALADRCVPQDESIDLLNVAFEQPVKKSHIIKKPKEKQKKSRRNPKKVHNFRESGSGESKSSQMQICTTQCDASDGTEHHLEQAASYDASESQVKNEHLPNGTSITDQFMLSCTVCPNMAEHAHIDRQSSVNAVNSRNTVNISEDITPNVESSNSFDVPDRQTGRIALAELNPKRKWNFIEVNIDQAELQNLRKSHIRKLIYPLQTVLDDSIGCAVWFAARGSGVLSQEKSQKIRSTAQVILCGMAADEQFAGYSRHCVTFKTKGWEKLLKELQEEMWRISARNLGRDDRIITDHGKECRFPFLDEIFTKFVSSIPIYHRADLRLPRGVGDKLLLRLCALKLGLVKTAVQPKRAIQFGSKIAKLDHRKEKGSDVCVRLT